MRKASKISLALIATAAAAVGGLTTAASATPTNLLTNGGFESTAVSGPFTTYATGADLGGWTVTGDSVDVIGSYWQAAEGSQSVDLSGNQPGGVSQTISTIPGVTYHLSFAMSANPDEGDIDPMVVTWGGANLPDSPYTFDASQVTKDAMGWTYYSADLVATGPSTTLAFASSSGDAYGPALDDVSLTQTNTGSVVTNTAPSQGSFTNHNATAVFHAVVTSADPACVIGRPVTFVIPGLTPTTGTTVLTDATGLASLKEIVGTGSYTVTSSVASTANCGSGSDTDSYSFATKPAH